MAEDPERREREAKAEAALKRATGTGNFGAQSHLINQLVASGAFDGLKALDIGDGRVGTALALIGGCAPKDPIEGMLAAQMIAVHNQAMECFACATQAQTVDLQDMHMRQAERLLDLFARQLVAMMKYRTRGQQRITVNHVHLREGAHAAAGAVASEGERNDDAEVEVLASEGDRGAPQSALGKRRRAAVGAGPSRRRGKPAPRAASARAR